LHADLEDLLIRHNHGQAGETEIHADYLEVIGTRI